MTELNLTYFHGIDDSLYTLHPQDEEVCNDVFIVERVEQNNAQMLDDVHTGQVSSVALLAQHRVWPVNNTSASSKPAMYEWPWVFAPGNVQLAIQLRSSYSNGVWPLNVEIEVSDDRGRRSANVAQVTLSGTGQQTITLSVDHDLQGRGKIVLRFFGTGETTTYHAGAKTSKEPFIDSTDILFTFVENGSSWDIFQYNGANLTYTITAAQFPSFIIPHSDYGGADTFINVTSYVNNSCQIVAENLNPQFNPLNGARFFQGYIPVQRRINVFTIRVSASHTPIDHVLDHDLPIRASQHAGLSAETNGIKRMSRLCGMGPDQNFLQVLSDKANYDIYDSSIFTMRHLGPLNWNSRDQRLIHFAVPGQAYGHPWTRINIGIRYVALNDNGQGNATMECLLGRLDLGGTWNYVDSDPVVADLVSIDPNHARYDRSVSGTLRQYFIRGGDSRSLVEGQIQPYVSDIVGDNVQTLWLSFPLSGYGWQGVHGLRLIMPPENESGPRSAWAMMIVGWSAWVS